MRSSWRPPSASSFLPASPNLATSEMDPLVRSFSDALLGVRELYAHAPGHACMCACVHSCVYVCIRFGTAFEVAWLQQCYLDLVVHCTHGKPFGRPGSHLKMQHMEAFPSCLLPHRTRSPRQGTGGSRPLRGLQVGADPPLPFGLPRRRADHIRGRPPRCRCCSMLWLRTVQYVNDSNAL